MEHNEWFNERVGTDSVNAAAKTAGLAQATLDGQLKRGSLPAESVIKICRAYDYNPVQGLVDTGYLNAEEVGTRIEITNWDNVSDAQFLAELLRRCDTDGALPDSLWSRPMDEAFIDEIASEADRPNLQVAPAYEETAHGEYLSEAPTSLWEEVEAADEQEMTPDEEVERRNDT